MVAPVVDAASCPIEWATALRGVLSDVSAVTQPGQRLFVGPANLRRTNYNDTYIYGLLPELEPGSYFLEKNPDSANRPRSRLASDVATADVVILTTAYDGWREPNDSRWPRCSPRHAGPALLPTLRASPLAPARAPPLAGSRPARM